MLHKMFLTFIVPEIEQEYRINYQPYMINEYKTLTTLILFVGTFIVLSFISESNYYYALYGLICSLPVILSRYFVSKYPQFSNFVYPFLQITVTFIYNIFALSKNQDNIPQMYFKYQWYYGFFAAISHICIYLQGTILCFQTVTMIGILVWHISRFDFSSPNGAYITVQIVIVFVVVFFCRREQERNKRLSYLKYRENMKWYQIMDKIVKKWTMFVQFDKSQDQLYLVQQSKAAQSEFMIQNNQEFRLFLRNTQIDQTSSQRTQSGSITLEDILLQLLSIKICKFDTMNSLKDSLYYTYVGYQQNTGRYLKVKLVEYYLSDSKMIVMILQNEKQQCKEVCQKYLAVENYFRCLTNKSLNLIEKTAKVISYKYLNLHNLIDDYNYFNAAFIWLNASKYVQNRSQVSVNKVEDQLKKIFQKSIQIQFKSEQCSFQSSLQVIMFISVNLIKFIQSQTKSNVIMKIQEQLIQQVRCFEFSFEAEELKIRQNLVHLFQENKYYQKQQSQLDDQNFKRIMDSYINFLEIMDSSKSTCLVFAIIKFLLSHYGLTNRIQYQKNQIKISFIDLDSMPGCLLQQ
ncbi:unnamed protein product (macronuclear) [Paramecium tetraurelia]|uniref:Transmembrane protein n=1 Tax=Paramecium tetraurelia TaxID=5888 RepID=A0BUV1_PARTE|nr:uncharacterized protein GSPATT00005564001 [Paramecium tetraurelia]CAK62318.1 unnamed protein product [Paramecium tetraurelia]|eukprot:XP_001429716.1 hypothetical protein (macronuclear) [Paramecium tetraurelia strain d4-2]